MVQLRAFSALICARVNRASEKFYFSSTFVTISLALVASNQIVTHFLQCEKPTPSLLLQSDQITICVSPLLFIFKCDHIVH